MTLKNCEPALIMTGGAFVLFLLINCALAPFAYNVYKGDGDNRYFEEQDDASAGIAYPNIRGYTDRVSVRQGDELQFKVSTASPSYSMDIIRIGRVNTTLYSVSNLKGVYQKNYTYSYRFGYNWTTTYNLTIPLNWTSGMYTARAHDSRGTSCDIVFIVKERYYGASSSLVVLASTNTWQAYNWEGGASFYGYYINDGSKLTRAHYVSYDRPWPRALIEKHHAGGERYILSWLESNNYSYEMLTDWDLDTEPHALDNYSTVIQSTHSEYWSSEMRLNLETHLHRGGNLIYLSGNGIYKKVTIDPVTKIMECHLYDRVPHTQTGELGGLWRNINRSETQVHGLLFNMTGYNSYAPYKVENDSHWIFTGCNVSNGDLIGRYGLNYGYGAKSGGASGWEMDKICSDTPSNAVLLGRGLNPKNTYTGKTYPDPSLNWDGGGGACMIYFDHPGGGGVFSTGSLSFGGSLVVDPVLTKMMKNVLTRFLYGNTKQLFLPVQTYVSITPHVMNPNGTLTLSVALIDWHNVEKDTIFTMSYNLQPYAWCVPGSFTVRPDAINSNLDNSTSMTWSTRSFPENGRWQVSFNISSRIKGPNVHFGELGSFVRFNSRNGATTTIDFQLAYADVGVTGKSPPEEPRVDFRLIVMPTFIVLPFVCIAFVVRKKK